MSKESEEKQALMAMVESGAGQVGFAQLRPNTFFSLEFGYNDVMYTGVGFAKVNWSDKWDADFGVEIARKKAVAHIVKQIMGKVEKY